PRVFSFSSQPFLDHIFLLHSTVNLCKFYSSSSSSSFKHGGGSSSNSRSSSLNAALPLRSRLLNLPPCSSLFVFWSLYPLSFLCSDACPVISASLRPISRLSLTSPSGRFGAASAPGFPLCKQKSSTYRKFNCGFLVPLVDLMIWVAGWNMDMRKETEFSLSFNDTYEVCCGFVVSCSEIKKQSYEHIFFYKE
ncbi:hypothetical protein LINGRAHAP2_LOCUS4404, partial [Linum grandiflorum]